MVQLFYMLIAELTWKNYCIFTRIFVFGYESGQPKCESYIGVRNNGKTHQIAYKWSSCENKDNLVFDVLMRISGYDVFTNVNGIEFPRLRITESNNDHGGLIICLDKGSAIDYLLVVALP